MGSVLQVCLGTDAGDEPHVVAVDSKNAFGERRPVPIATLRSSRLLTVRAAPLRPLPGGDSVTWGWNRASLSSGSSQISFKHLELVPPVTFVLQCGAGPVYLSGQHVIRECHSSGVPRGCAGIRWKFVLAAVPGDGAGAARGGYRHGARCQLLL